MTDAIDDQYRNQLNIIQVQRSGDGESSDRLGRLHRQKVHLRCILRLLPNCIIHGDALFLHLPNNSHNNKDKQTNMGTKSHITHISTYKSLLLCWGRGWFVPQPSPCQPQLFLPPDFSAPFLQKCLPLSVDLLVTDISYPFPHLFDHLCTSCIMAVLPGPTARA